MVSAQTDVFCPKSAPKGMLNTSLFFEGRQSLTVYIFHFESSRKWMMPDINNPMMKPSNERIGFHLDVRPSLDSYESIKCRLKGLFMWIRQKITKQNTKQFIFKYIKNIYYKNNMLSYIIITRQIAMEGRASQRVSRRTRIRESYLWFIKIINKYNYWTNKR